MRLSSLVLLFCTAGCEPALDDVVYVHGQAVDHRGRLLGGVAIQLLRNTEPSCGLEDDGTQGEYAFYRSDTTREDGRFAFELLVAETMARSPHGFSALCFEVRLPGGDVLGESAFRFRGQPSDVEIPRLVQWNEMPTLEQTAEGGFRVGGPSERPGLDAGQTRHAVSWVSSAGVIWSNPIKDSAVVVREVLEDFRDIRLFAEASGQEWVSTFGPWGASYLMVARSRTPTVPLPAGSMVPVSRHAKCTYPGAPVVCPLTDGRLTFVSLRSMMWGKEVVVELPAATKLRRAVLRDVSFSGFAERALLRVEGKLAASDAFSTLATRDVESLQFRQFLDLKLSDVPVDRVRVRVEYRTDAGDVLSGVGGMSELSLFE